VGQKMTIPSLDGPDVSINVVGFKPKDFQSKK
jgi:hypothetical protein